MAQTIDQLHRRIKEQASLNLKQLFYSPIEPSGVCVPCVCRVVQYLPSNPICVLTGIELSHLLPICLMILPSGGP